jgi:hypothetical protein
MNLSKYVTFADPNGEHVHAACDTCYDSLAASQQTLTIATVSAREAAQYLKDEVNDPPCSGRLNPCTISLSKFADQSLRRMKRAHEAGRAIAHECHHSSTGDFTQQHDPKGATELLVSIYESGNGDPHDVWLT